ALKRPALAHPAKSPEMEESPAVRNQPTVDLQTEPQVYAGSPGQTPWRQQAQTLLHFLQVKPSPPCAECRQQAMEQVTARYLLWRCRRGVRGPAAQRRMPHRPVLCQSQFRQVRTAAPAPATHPPALLLPAGRARAEA